METRGLTPMNVEKALDTLYEAINQPSTEVNASYFIVKEFIDIIKEEYKKQQVPALLRKKEEFKE